MAALARPRLLAATALSGHAARCMHLLGTGSFPHQSHAASHLAAGSQLIIRASEYIAAAPSGRAAT
eukprot:6430714-Alexandrium_andersonii.AAC.1